MANEDGLVGIVCWYEGDRVGEWVGYGTPGDWGGKDGDGCPAPVP
jgi:hypothetical protein